MNKARSFAQKILKFELFRKIRFRLIISFMVPIAFVILLGALSFLKASDGITTSYEKSTRQAINMAGKYLEFGIETVLTSANQYVNDDLIRRYFAGIYDSDSVEKYLQEKNIQNNINTKRLIDKFISEIFILSKDNDPITTNLSTGEEIYQGFVDTELGQNVMNNRSINHWVSNEEYLDENLSVSSGQYALRLIRTIMGTDAILIIDVKADSIKEALRDLEFDRTGLVGFVAADGKEIVARDIDGNLEVNIADEAVFYDQDFYYEVANSDELEGSKIVQYNNKPYMFMYSKIGDSGAMICGLVPKATILSQADSIKNITLLVGLISIVAGVGIAIIISSGIDKVIKSIISKLRLAAKGDLTVDFTIKRKDEFKILTEEIQHTFSNMKNLIQQVKERSGEVSLSSVDVTKTAQDFLKATKEISVAISEVESGIMQQAKDAEECLSQMDNLSKKILVVSENTKEIGKIANHTKQNVLEGTVTTEELNTQTRETARITADIINEIQNLEKKSSSINNIINVINEIADQTNLLSLNASIEAARAGEAGRGFAVVASEIRTLADQSKDSVNNIRSIIEGIQKDTEKAVQIARAAEDVMRLQESAVNNTTKSYENINESVEHLVVYLNDIIENVENIEDARVSTLGAVESISAVLEEIAASSNTVNQSASEQLSSVETLSKSADDLNNNADVLVESVEKFKV